MLPNSEKFCKIWKILENPKGRFDASL